FLLTSGLHSPAYWEKFRVIESPAYTSQLCQMIAEHFRNENIQIVAGPTTGGIILAYETARQLGVRSIFAERISPTERTFKRGFKINNGERVLIVDDILTTGGSLKQVITTVNKQGGNIVGIGVLVNRSEQEPDFGFPLFSCLRSVTTTYKPENCPLCAKNIPLVKPGSS
ncbi:MAG: orotate phosphoribosyltransferase, partial [Dehalococcoidales bacterium]|nr:orotate phosphoribosyltransferase [Dehalococcoidales bacterium]